MSEHEHPHGPQNVRPNPERVWICDDGGAVFTDEEAQAAVRDGEWGRPCKCVQSGRKVRCEGHLDPYLPGPVKEATR